MSVKNMNVKDCTNIDKIAGDVIFIGEVIMMPSMNVSLTKELMDYVQSKVSTGMYNNASEVIRDALRRLDTDEELVYELKLNRLKESLAPGIRQAKNGEFVDQNFDEIIAEVEQEKTRGMSAEL